MAGKLNMKIVDQVAAILVIIGALNWGLVGIANIDLVNLILGTIPILAKVVYVLVGVAGAWMVYTMFVAKKK